MKDVESTPGGPEAALEETVALHSPQSAGQQSPQAEGAGQKEGMPPDKKRKTIGIAVAAIVLVAGICIALQWSIRSVDIYPPEPMVVGEEVDVYLDVRPQNPLNDYFHMFSSDESIAYIREEDGLLVAVGPGTATISVISENRAASAYVEVTVLQPAETLLLDKHALSVPLGGEVQLHPIVYPANTTDTLAYQSVDAAIARVGENGVVHGEAVGSTTVLVTCGALMEHVDITVRVPVEDIRLPETEIALELGKTYQLQPEVVPQEASAEFAFVSEDPDIATVDEAGLITATEKENNGKPRSVDIQIRTPDGFTKTITVTVNNSYTYDFSEKRTKLKGWQVYTMDFANPVVDCTGFLYMYTLVESKPANRIEKLVGKKFYIYAYKHKSGWEQVGEFNSSAVGTPAIVKVEFEKMDITKVACVPGGSYGFSGSCWTNDFLTGLQY